MCMVPVDNGESETPTPCEPTGTQKENEETLKNETQEIPEK